MTKTKPRDQWDKQGRPPTINKDTLNLIREAVGIGCTFKQARDYACVKGKPISETSFYDYLREHPDFRAELEYLKANPVLKAKNTIYKNLDNPKVARWYLEKKASKEFGNVLNINGNVNSTINTADDLTAIITGIMELQKINGNQETPEQIIQRVKEEERKQQTENNE